MGDPAQPNDPKPDSHPICTTNWAVHPTQTIPDECDTVRVPIEIFLVGPLLALAVLAVIAVVADVASLRPPRGPRRAEKPNEFGLLRPVALLADLSSARTVRDRLMSVGIRATVGTGRDGFVRVLVFDDEYDRARDVV